MNRDLRKRNIRLLILSILFIVSTTSVVISGIYWLKPRLNDTVAAKCTISLCKCTTECSGESSKRDSSYYSCNMCNYDYTILIGNTIVSNVVYTSDEGDYCTEHPVGSMIDCYYLKSHPTGSLTLLALNNYVGAIVYIIICGLISIYLFIYIIYQIRTRTRISKQNYEELS